MKEQEMDGFTGAGFAFDILTRGGDINGDTHLCHLCKHKWMPSCPHRGMVKGICNDYSFSGISSDEIVKIIAEIIPPDSNEEISKQEHLGF